MEQAELFPEDLGSLGDSRLSTPEKRRKFAAQAIARLEKKWKRKYTKEEWDTREDGGRDYMKTAFREAY